MTDKSVVPEGMVAWAGGDCAPSDWDDGPVQSRDGLTYTPNIHEKDEADCWRHLKTDPCGDIIAYTPKPNPLSLETSDLDPITPEEDALATAILAAMGLTRQSLDTVVRAIRDGLVKAGAVIVPVEPTEAMVEAVRYPGNGPVKIRLQWSAMLSAQSVQSGGEGGEAK